MTGLTAQSRARPTRIGAATAAVVVIGTALRFAVAARGHNFDFESYEIVAQITHDSGNVYAETERYNYGPVWFWILHAFDELSRWVSQPDVFRGAIIALLTTADLCIAAILRRRFGPVVAAVFFLNPVSIIITGYHNQFDTLALATALLGLVWFSTIPPDAQARRLVPPLLLIGLSLSIKHVAFLLPLWLAFAQRDTARRLLVLLLPLAVFALSFVPYLDAIDGIKDNVIGYRSFDNGLYQRLAPSEIEELLPPTLVLVAALAAAGWLFRRRPPLEQGLLYTLALVCFSPALANQYLAIPMAAVVAFLNPALAAYAAAATVILIARPDGLHWTWLDSALRGAPSSQNVYAYAVAFLLVGLAWLVWSRAARETWHRLRAP